MSKSKNSVSTYNMKLDASRNYKTDSFSVNSLQNFCINAISGKYTRVTNEVSENKVESANEVRKLSKISGMTIESFKFDIFLKNCERLSRSKLTYKSGKKTKEKQFFSLLTYLDVCEKYHLEQTSKVVIQETKPETKPETIKLNRSQSGKLAQLTKKLKAGKITEVQFNEQKADILRAA
jgi:hypothetical protein